MAPRVDGPGRFVVRRLGDARAWPLVSQIFFSAGCTVALRLVGRLRDLWNDRIARRQVTFENLAGYRHARRRLGTRAKLCDLAGREGLAPDDELEYHEIEGRRPQRRRMGSARRSVPALFVPAIAAERKKPLPASLALESAR